MYEKKNVVDDIYIYTRKREETLIIALLDFARKFCFYLLYVIVLLF